MIRRWILPLLLLVCAAPAAADVLYVSNYLDIGGYFTGSTNQTVMAVNIRDSSNHPLGAFRVGNTGTITNVIAGGGYDGVILPDVVANITDNENYCGEPGQPYWTSDIAGPDGEGLANRDCVVSLYDLAVFARQWLKCTNLFIAGCSWEADPLTQ